jgi:hypothetical protein
MTVHHRSPFGPPGWRPLAPEGGSITLSYPLHPQAVGHRKRINRLRARRARRRRDWDQAPHSRAVFDEMVRLLLGETMAAHPTGRHSYYAITDAR